MSIAALLLLQFTSAAINIDRKFLSGAADTTQLITIFPKKLDEAIDDGEPTIIKQQQTPLLLLQLHLKKITTTSLR